jgi:hypothetical protein
VIINEEGIFRIKYLFVLGFISVPKLNFSVQYSISYCHRPERQKEFFEWPPACYAKKFTLEQAMKAQRGSRFIALLFF